MTYLINEVLLAIRTFESLLNRVTFDYAAIEFARARTDQSSQRRNTNELRQRSYELTALNRRLPKTYHY